MNIQNKTGFTLVELIVVITILSVLATVGFISFTGYGASARDSVRLSDIHNIEKSLGIYKIKEGKYPEPDNKVNITSSGTVLTYQGYAGEKVLGLIGVYGGGVDPITEDYYTLSTNLVRTKYQILSYFENEENVNNQTSFVNKTQASLVNRFPQLSGDKLGIILNNVTKEPIQTTGMDIDISQPTSTYEAYLSNEEIITGVNISLGTIYSKSSCKRLKENDFTLQDGKYMIDPLADGNQQEAYCNMTMDGGGWTLISSDYDGLNNDPRPRIFPEYGYRGSNFDSKIIATEILHINETDNGLGEPIIKRHIILDSYIVNGVERFDKFIGLITGLDEYEEVYNSRAYTDRKFGGRVLASSENNFFNFEQISRMGISVTTGGVTNHNSGITTRAGRSCNYVIGKAWDCFEFGSISDNRINGKNYNAGGYRISRGFDPIIKQHIYIR